MTEQHVQILAVVPGPEGIDITYGRIPQDVRKNGLIWQHQVTIPRGSDYDDEIEAVEEALSALIDDVLEDEETAEPVDLVEEDEDDEEDDE